MYLLTGIKFYKMKLKYLIISMVVSFLLAVAGIGTVHSQGIFSISDKKSLDKTKTTTTTEQTEPLGNGGGIFRGPPPDDATDKDPDPGVTVGDDPIGEGILILSLLSGGYALVRRKIKNQNEESI